MRQSWKVQLVQLVLLAKCLHLQHQLGYGVYGQYGTPGFLGSAFFDNCQSFPGNTFITTVWATLCLNMLNAITLPWQMSMKAENFSKYLLMNSSV